MEISSSYEISSVPSNQNETCVNEGKASVTFPSARNVFYNPVQEFNRDLSIAVIREYAKERQEVSAFVSRDLSIEQNGSRKEPINVDEPLTESRSKSPVDGRDSAHKLKLQDSDEQGITILEALAASGLRSIRYAKEIPAIKSIIANDLAKVAIDAMSQNIKANNVESIVTPSHSDAVLLMHQHKHYNKQFDVVDLDPYGSPTQFLDAAVQCVKDGGLLLVTCTDTAVLCGNASETCFAKYGSVSLKIKCCHEMALRIILQCIESHANRYGRYIVPLISLSVDFYVRVFVRLYSSPAIVKHSASKLAMIYQCVGCETASLQPLGKVKPHENGKDFKFSCANGPPVGKTCIHCGFRHKMGGPIWAKNIHDVNFVEKLLLSVEATKDDFATVKRIIGVLHLIREELVDVPLFYSLDRVFNIVHLPHCGIVKFRSALLNAGYRVSDSHASKNSVKTDAPPNVVWDVVRTWAKEVTLGKRAMEEGTPGRAILQQEPQTAISFAPHRHAIPESREKKLMRYQQNPTANWGPKARATTNLLDDSSLEKSKRLQGKRNKTDTCDLNKNLRKYPCKRFKQGKCDLGDSCKYSHSEDDTSTPT